MSRRGWAVTVVVAGTAMALVARALWPTVELSPAPAGLQLAALVASGLVEALAFGAALAVALLGGPVAGRLTTTPARARTARFAAAWVLGSWWPHTTLHMHFGMTARALAVIEPVFHAGTIVAAGALLWAVATRRAHLVGGSV
jgi:hypothetical protein